MRKNPRKEKTKSEKIENAINGKNWYGCNVVNYCGITWAYRFLTKHELGKYVREYNDLDNQFNELCRSPSFETCLKRAEILEKLKKDLSAIMSK